MHRSYDVCVVGAGLSGLGLAAFVHRLRPELRMLVLERAAGPGGAVASWKRDGYQAEWGPHGFLDNCAESQDLVRLAGLETEVVRAPLSRFIRHVCLHGRLQAVPQHPLKLIRAPLMSWRDKLRVAGEYRVAPLAGEPSVAQWVAHRFGPGLLPFADVVFTGTYAGDIERLQMDAVMPGVRELEQQHGSVIRGLLHRWRQKRSDRARPGLPAMTSFRDGMARFPQGLADHLLQAGVELRFACPVEAFAPEGEGWLVQSVSGAVVCRQLVLALPVNACLELVQAALPDAPPPVPSIAEARIYSVLLGFGPGARIPVGFGYLAAEREQRFALGALFSSHMFADRAPAGHHLVEALVGGRRHPERLELDDQALIAAVYADLRTLMYLPEPVFSEVLRPASAIPQLEQGHTALESWRQTLHRERPGLHCCGFGWKGIGINEMIKEAHRLALRITGRDTDEEAGPEVRKIYV
ncbi:MAG: protoporphyrinogen oxidase [Desulfobulbus sp.]|jgi:oxygen-dependent protoporphyrinogen oxidase